MLPLTSPRLKGASSIQCALLATLLFFLSAPPSTALDPNKLITQYSLSAWRVAEGLPQDTVRSIAQTPDGYLWIGTEAGLVRFDGVRFKIFDRKTYPDVFLNPHIYTLATAPDGTLWIGTNGGGLVRYREGEFKRFGIEDGLPTGRITAIEPTETRTLWIGTYGGGLVKMDGESFDLLDTDDGLSHNVIFDLDMSSEGELWIATYGGGLNRFHEGKLEIFDQRNGLIDNNVWSVLHGDDGALWIGTNGGLQRWQDGDSKTWTQADGLSHNRVLSLLEDRQGNLWIGTYGGGLNLMRGPSFSHLDRSDGLTSAHVWSLFEDREETLWIGTLGGGLNQLKDGPFTTYSLAEGTSSELPSSFFEDRDDSLWIATRTQGLDHFIDGRFENFTTADGLSSDSLWSLLRDRRGDLWVATSGKGVDRLRDGVWRNMNAAIGLEDSTVFTLIETRSGDLWLGTNRGVHRRDVASGTWFHYTEVDGLASNQARTFLEDRQGRLWIGTTGGLSHFDGTSFTTFCADDGLLSNNVWVLHEDAELDGVLWIGTGGGGLARFENGTFFNFTTANGFFDDLIRVVIEDDQGFFWMASSRGIIRMAKRSLEEHAGNRGEHAAERLPYVAYGRRDGMKSNACYGGYPAGLRTADGRIWFATLDGITVVDPEKILSTPAPSVLIEEALVDDAPFPASREVSSRPKTWSFRFTAPTSLIPDKTYLRYRLIGFDDDWREATDERKALYSNLAPGSYRFEVMASDEYGRWNGKPTTFAFVVLPTFFETWAFYGLCALALIGLVFGWHAWRLRRLKSREQKLERRVEEAIARLKVLTGLLPICASCKRIRDDTGYWEQLETYIDEHSEASFSHGICPDCTKEIYGPDIAKEVDSIIRRQTSP